MRGKCPNPQPDCPVRKKEGACYSDSHHIFYPRALYRTKKEKKFFAMFQIQLCRRVHNVIQLLEPPAKPSKEVIDEILGE